MNRDEAHATIVLILSDIPPGYRLADAADDILNAIEQLKPHQRDKLIAAGAEALREQVKYDWWTINTGHDWDHEKAAARCVIDAIWPTESVPLARP